MSGVTQSFSVLKIFNYKKEQEVRILRIFTDKDKAIEYVNLMANENCKKHEQLYINKMKDNDFLIDIFGFNNNSLWYPIYTIFIATSYVEDDLEISEQNGNDNEKNKKSDKGIDFSRGWVYAIYETELEKE